MTRDDLDRMKMVVLNTLSVHPDQETVKSFYRVEVENSIGSDMIDRDIQSIGIYSKHNDIWPVKFGAMEIDGHRFMSDDDFRHEVINQIVCGFERVWRYYANEHEQASPV